MRYWLPRLALNHPVSVVMVFVACLVIGAVAWFRIPLQLMPSGFEAPVLSIWVPVRDSTPVETDDQVVAPIADALSTLTGLKHQRSSASDSAARFNLTFFSGTPMDEAYNEVVDRLERATADLSDEVWRYVVRKMSSDDQPMVYVGVSFPQNLSYGDFVLERHVLPKLERVPGVAAVDAYGVPDQQVTIDYDRDKLRAHGTDLGNLTRRLARDNFQRTGGQITDRGLLQNVRFLAKFSNLDTLRKYPIGNSLVLADVASVSLRPETERSLHRLNGQDAALIVVRKESLASAVDVGHAVQQVLDALNADPRVEGIQLFTLFNQGETVGASLANLLDSVLTGGLFACVVLALFLRDLRMTLLIALSIPFSLLVTVGVLYLTGSSLNLLSLLGLMLAVGMVVDNTIVVVETIYRHRSQGATAWQAALEGTAEVGIAVVLSTSTTLAVFLPLVLMGQQDGFAFFMGALGIPVVIALVVSLVVALVFAPLATHAMGHAAIRPEPAWLSWLIARYEQLLRLMLRRPADTVAWLLAIALLTLWIPGQRVHYSLANPQNNQQIEIFFTVPQEATRSERLAIVTELESTLESLREDLGIRVYYARLSGNSTQGFIRSFLTMPKPWPLIGWALPKGLSRSQLIEAITERLPKEQPGVQFSVGTPAGLGGQGAGNPLQLTLTGKDMDTLQDLANNMVRRIDPLPGVLTARLNDPDQGARELRLQLRQDQLDHYGFQARTVAEYVAFSMREIAFEPLETDGRTIDIVARYKPTDRDNQNDVLQTPLIATATGKVVPLRAVASLTPGNSPAVVQRIGKRTGLELTVDLDEDLSLDQGLTQVRTALSTMQFPTGYQWKPGQSLEQQAKDRSVLISSLVMGIIFVYLIMGMLFESWILPFSILTSVLMALVGVYWSLWIMGSPLDTMAGIGLVILVGIVVNNGIVLVDRIQQLRTQGISLHEALVRAGVRRFRPIVMTALTTVCGLIPMAVGNASLVGISYGPMGQAVIGGLLWATVLTLLVLPLAVAGLVGLREHATNLVRFVRQHQKIQESP